MGVKLTDIVGISKQIITFENLKGKKVAVDAFNTIYQFLSSIRGMDGNPLRDLQGNTTSHLSGLLYRNLNLLKNDIKPIYVFDGKPNVLKQNEINRRKQLRQLSEHKYNEAYDQDDQDSINKYAKGSSNFKGDIFKESKYFLSLMGIPVVEALEDGEAQASYLIQKNQAWSIVSQDYDSFLFGANRIIRNLSIGQTRTVNGRQEKVDIEFYNLEKVLSYLHITREQLVDMSILVGVDFFEGIKGIGDKSAYKLVTEYKTIENIIENSDKKDKFKALTPEFLSQVRNIFLNPKTTDNYTIKFEKPQYEKIYEFLVEEHNFSKDRIEKVISELKSKYSTKVQWNLDFAVKKE